MSRSKKKNPVQQLATSKSKAFYKKNWHGKLRAKERDSLICDKEIPSIHEVTNLFGIAKDGKFWKSDLEPKYFRK